MNTIASTFLALFLLCGMGTTAAHADPVNNTDPESYVLALLPLKGDRLEVTMSDGYRVKVNPCRYEDGRRCYWNAQARGNGVGRSFVVVRGVRYFLNMRGL